MDNKKNGIPKLRFPGFTGAWEQRKLGGFLQEYSIKSKIENEYPLLSSTNKGMEYREGRTASESNIGYKILKINDLVLSPQNLWLGNININTLVTGIVSPSYKTLKINNLSLYFLLPQLKTKRMLEKYKQVSVQGASVVRRNLDFTEFMNISLVIPTNKEQEQIGEFFKQLDSLIALHQRKLEHLQEQKKGLLQKMFPKNGETVPEVRFPGFTDAWEQRKFFDNIEKVIDFRGRTPKKLGMEWSAEGYTALSALNVKDGYIDFTADVHYANQDLYDKWMAGNELYKGQVLFTTEAPMGNVAQVPDNRKYVLSQRTIAFNVDKTKVTNDFLAVLLRSQNVQHTLKSLASGGTAQGVSQKSLSQLKVILPINPKEQQEIGNFFNHFDSLIALHQRKLDHLELMKKGLLQQMFV